MESKWLVRVAGVVVGILLASTPVFAQEYAGIQMPAFTNPSLTAPAPEAVPGKLREAPD